MNYIQSTPPEQHAKRMRLPNRRACETFNLDYAGSRFQISLGRESGGGIAELFVENAKSNSSLDLLGKDCAVIVSIALQCGVDLAALHASVCRDESGSAQSFIGAVLDAVVDAETPAVIEAGLALTEKTSPF